MVIIALMMMITIRILSNESIDSEIKRELIRTMDSCWNDIFIMDGKLNVAKNFSYQSNNVYFLVLTRDDEIIAGEYPENVREELLEYQIKNKRTRSISVDGEQYYFRDVRIGKIDNERIYLRGILCGSDVDSFYHSIELFSYIGIISVLSVILLCEVFLAWRISRELKCMCQISESIGSNLDMSKRMNADYRFYEIAVLAKANDRMLDRLEQTLLLQEQFTADVSHELRTPVSVILAQCQYAEKKVDSLEEYREVLDVVYRQSKKIDALILQLLNLSRLDQDRMQMEKEELDLIEIVQSVCEEQQEKFQDTVSITMDFEEAYAIGDIGLIAIVIQNLVTNAAKFSRPGGEIRVRTGECGNEVYVEVQDDGIGIEEENKERIFRRFYKCDESRNVEGFGLGLSLSKKIAEKHGGRITVVSELGNGSAFTLYLPAKE